MFVAIFKEKVNHLSTQNLTFSTDITAFRAFKCHVVNLFIFIFTFGLGFPIIFANNIKLYANSLSVYGFENLIVGKKELDPETLSDKFDDAYSSFNLDILDVF